MLLCAFQDVAVCIPRCATFSLSKHSMFSYKVHSNWDFGTLPLGSLSSVLFLWCRFYSEQHMADKVNPTLSTLPPLCYYSKLTLTTLPLCYHFATTLTTLPSLCYYSKLTLTTPTLPPYHSTPTTACEHFFAHLKKHK